MINKDILSKGDTTTFDESEYILYNDWLKLDNMYIIDRGFEKYYV